MSGSAHRASGSHRPELRLQVQLIHTLNETTDVVTKYLAQCFVNLRRLNLAAQQPKFLSLGA